MKKFLLIIGLCVVVLLNTSCFTLLSTLLDSSYSTGNVSSGSVVPVSSGATLVSSKSTDYYYSSSYSTGKNPNWSIEFYDNGNLYLYDYSGKLKVEIDCASFSDAQRLYSAIASNDMNYNNTLDACINKRLAGVDSEYKNGYILYSYVTFGRNY